MHAQAMFATHPVAHLHKDPLLTACVEACYDCAQTCTSCADACLGEEMVAELRRCIGLDLDCADICMATGSIMSRGTATDRQLSESVLQACATACGICAEECERHATHHEHCRVCAQACRQCERACRDMLSSKGMH